MAGQDVWLRSARQRQRRLLTTVLLACLLLLLAAFVAASRWELHRAPVLVGPMGQRHLVAGYSNPLAGQPSFVQAWEREDGSWSPMQEIRGRYQSACFFRGLLYVFFDDRSYSSYRQGVHVERHLFPFAWAPASVVSLGEGLVALGGEGEEVLRVAELRQGEWTEGPTFAATVKRVENVQAAAVGEEVVVAWQEGGDEGGRRRGLFVTSYGGGQWQPVCVLTLSQVDDCALGAVDGEVVLISAEPDPGRRARRRFWERRRGHATWLRPRPVRLPSSPLAGRVLDFSVAADPRGPLLVVSRASALECYVCEGEAWRRVEVLGSGGRPGGLGAGSWLLVSVGALVVLGSAGALLFVRAGPLGEGGPGSEIGYASVMERGAAYAFDMILAFFVVLVLSGSYEPTTTATITVVSHLVYGTALEAYWGRTLGKRLVGIVVVTPGLEVIGPGRSLLRNLVRLVDSFPVYFIGLISIGLSGRRQRVGDRLAGTVVLRESALMVPRVGTVPGVSPTGDAEAEG